MKFFMASRGLLWLLLALPGLWILGRWALAPSIYGYGHAIADSGLWSAWLLMVTLAVTPARLLFRGHLVSTWLVRRRRDFGVASFAYAAGHTVIYLANKDSLEPVLKDLGSREII